MPRVTPIAQMTATCQSPWSAPVRTAAATAPVPNSTIMKVPTTSPTSADFIGGSSDLLRSRAARLHGQERERSVGEELPGRLDVEVQVVHLPAEPVRVGDPELVGIGVAAGHSQLLVDVESSRLHAQQVFAHFLRRIQLNAEMLNLLGSPRRCS